MTTVSVRNNRLSRRLPAAGCWRQTGPFPKLLISTNHLQTPTCTYSPGLQILGFIVFTWQTYTSLKHHETLTERFLSPSVSNDVFPPVLFPQNDAEHLLSVSHGAAVSGHLWIHRLWQQLDDSSSYGLMMTSTWKKTTNTQLEVWRNEYSAAFSAASLLRGVWKCISSYSVCCFSIPEDFNQPLQCFKFKILMLRIQFCVWTDVFLFFLCSYLLEIQL